MGNFIFIYWQHWLRAVAHFTYSTYFSVEILYRLRVRKDKHTDRTTQCIWCVIQDVCRYAVEFGL